MTQQYPSHMRRSRFGENFLFLLPLAFVVIAFLVGPDEVHGWSFPQQQQRRRPTTTTTTTTNQSPSSIRRKGSIQRSKGTITRQKLIQTFIVSTIGITIGGRGEGRFQQIAHAIEEVETISTSSSSSLYQRNVPGIKSSSISYQIQLPKDSSSSSSSSSSAFQESQKPVKTHLDEVNLMSDTIKGYQYGITVDPVRINSLKEFGTPEEVAARVVTAEVNRDGIFEVTLMDDPMATTGPKDVVAYLLHYLSVGKRGNKHIWNKIIIQNQLLYVLTAQCKEGDYPTLGEEMKQTVTSFQVLV